MAQGEVRVSIIGTGDIGRGWAALIAAAGWPVALYDADIQSLDRASADIATRARVLVAMGRAEEATAERGIAQVEVAKSLLQACSEAEWIIEAIHENLTAKQKLFESLESAGPRARVVSSSSSSIPPRDIAARVLRKDRCLVTHPLNPPELIPLVEVAPSPETDKLLLEVVKGWLRALNRIPVVIKKPIPGNVGGRIAAAVWRECIDLVLKGVIDIDDLDRAVSQGPALGWAAAGPLLTYHLAAGTKGVSGFFQHLLHTFEAIWEDLADWKQLDHEQQTALIQGIERSYRGQLEHIRAARDRRLAAILRGLEQVREGRTK
jgi:3-hydroxyacyl-CoA dehydrogenase